MSLARALAIGALCLACAEPEVAGRSSPSLSHVYSVRDFGARGDGVTLDTAAIQAGVDALPPGAVLRFPAGTYRVDTVSGIRLKDDVHLDLGAAVVTGDNVDGARCRLFEIEGARNVTIQGGTLVGSRAGSPEWGMGILASDAEDLVIQNVTLRDFHFDGILLTGNRGCRRVTVTGVSSENNRRTGLAIVHASDVTVEDSTFAGTRGQSPEAGVNCEPNRGESVQNVRFRRCTFRGNANVGLYMHRALGDAVEGVSVEDSVVEENGYGIVANGVRGLLVRGNAVRGHRGPKTVAIVVGDTEAAEIQGNRLHDNFRGILAAGAPGAEVRGNAVVGTGPAAAEKGGDGGDGIVCLGLRGPLAGACVVEDNTVSRTAGSGIVAQLVTRVRLEGNTVEEAGQRGILLRTAAASEVRANAVEGAGAETGARYDAIEVAVASSGNTVADNVIRLGPGTREPVSVCGACPGNQVSGNVVLPD